MKCEECGKEFRPTGHGSPQRYCSVPCRKRAYYKRKKNGETAPVKQKPVPRELDRQEFERMMDDGVEDTLRHVRDRLKVALDDDSTPANALPAISRQLIAVVDRLETLDGSGGLGDLVDSDEEVPDGLGASIV